MSDPTPVDRLNEAKRKMALRDWNLRLRVEEADAVRDALGNLERDRARLASALRALILEVEEVAQKLDLYPDSLGEAMLDADKALASLNKEEK